MQKTLAVKIELTLLIAVGITLWNSLLNPFWWLTDIKGLTSTVVFGAFVWGMLGGIPLGIGLYKIWRT
jgi:hypothetical protein